MSPRPSDPNVRDALIDTAARLLVDEGPHALSTRRLTTEVGLSTTAVYTYFGGIDDLHRAVAVEGFARLARALDAVPRSDDPVADLAALGGAYLLYGVANPDLYRFVFRAQPEDPEAGTEAFDRLTDAVARAVASGRFTTDPDEIAVQLWVTTHGVTSLYLAGMLTLDDALVTLTRMGTNLFVGFGDSRESAAASVSAASDAFPDRSTLPESTEVVGRG